MKLECVFDPQTSHIHSNMVLPNQDTENKHQDLKSIYISSIGINLCELIKKLQKSIFFSGKQKIAIDLMQLVPPQLSIDYSESAEEEKESYNLREFILLRLQMLVFDDEWQQKHHVKSEVASDMLELYFKRIVKIDPSFKENIHNIQQVIQNI